jgi:hypothetical protein
MDLNSKQVVGWVLSKQPNAQLTKVAFKEITNWAKIGFC